MSLVASAERLSRALDALCFGPPVAHVYDPLTYAAATHRAYLERYGAGPKQVVMVGMNPGPWGMAQTGVPFGHPQVAREWLGISGDVGRPPREHPRRPVLGFASPRAEGSGTRVYAWARERFGTPEAFFARFFFANYCPLLFLAADGANVTPDKLRRADRGPLFAACDAALREVVETLKPRFVVGFGAFAEARAREALAGFDVVFGRVPHPSPANPQANRGWAPQVDAALRALGVDLPV